MVYMDDKKEKEIQQNYSAGRERTDFVQKYIINNIGIKLLALVTAIVVWVAIVNIEDPYKERTFNVEVETINEDALSSVNKVYEIIEGSMAQVRVKGKKSIVDRLKADDIRATADLSDLSAVNAVAIVPELKKTVSDEPVLECKTVLKVSLEDKASKQIKVTVATEGTPQAGYSVGECMASPNMLEVTGGKGVIDKIDSVRVTINVSGIGEDLKKRVTPVAYDADGKAIESSTLDYGVRKVRVNVHVLKTKTIPVNIKITGKPASGYEFVDAECQPESIQVAGDRKELANISEVNIPVDITGMRSATGTVEQNISIQDYLPEGVSVLADYAQVSLRIGIEKLMSKKISVPVKDIKFASLSDHLSARILGDHSVVSMTIQGISSVLDEINIDDYSAYVDCEGLRAGKHRLKVHLDLKDSSAIVKTEYVTVRIDKGDSTADGGDSVTTEEPKATATPTQTPSDKTDEGEKQ